MTGGDKIRQMSNEELSSIIVNCYYCKCFIDKKSCEGIACKEGVKAYLDMEVEDG